MQRYQTTAFTTPYMQKMHTNVKNCLFDVDYMAMQPWIILQMKLYAKSIGRIRSLIQNKSGLHRREISDDSLTYIVLCPSCYQSTQYTSQSRDLDDADSLAFLHELFESK
jgi:hypothetical protein